MKEDYSKFAEKYGSLYAAYRDNDEKLLKLKNLVRPSDEAVCCDQVCQEPERFRFRRFEFFSIDEIESSSAKTDQLCFNICLGLNHAPRNAFELSQPYDSDSSVVQLICLASRSEVLNIGPKGYHAFKDSLAESAMVELETYLGCEIACDVEACHVSDPVRWYFNTAEPNQRNDDEFRQNCIVEQVTDFGNAVRYVIGPDLNTSTKDLLLFRAGQYISAEIIFDGNIVHKPYSICSSPADVLTEHPNYSLTIERFDGGFSSQYVTENWKKGTKVTLSAPLGNFSWNRLSDSPRVIAIAGGSGITPFLSMAHAIADGMEDFELIILYGNRSWNSILFLDELANILARTTKVRVVHVLSDEVREGCEHGLIDAALIDKYREGKDCTILPCGIRSMYNFLDTQIPLLGLKQGRYRLDLYGEYGDPTADTGFPSEEIGKTYDLTVISNDGEITISCPATSSLLCAMEKATIQAPAHCRSGQCGWCRSKLVSGKVFIPRKSDGRLSSDLEDNLIHPCSSYPLSNVVIKLPQHRIVQ